MSDTCMHDRDTQCFCDCPECVRSINTEIDWDRAYEEEKEMSSEK